MKRCQIQAQPISGPNEVFLDARKGQEKGQGCRSTNVQLANL
jgi:hypothetical protein